MATVPITAPVRLIRFERGEQVRAGIIAALFIAVFWELFDFIPNQFGSASGLGRLTYQWVMNEDWNHGPLIPVFAGYLVYINWPKIRRCAVRFSGFGAIFLLAGLAIYALCIANIIRFGYAKPVSMMITLLGVIVLLNGVPAMRYLWLPWLYLFFAIPIPERLYRQITTPLRKMVTYVAARILEVVPDLRIEDQGTTIQFLYHGRVGKIGVVDACSGMRSLITLCAIGIAVAYMSARPWSHRLIMIIACVPIAIFCNFVRVILTCILNIFVDPKYAEGTYHMMLGLLTLALGFAIFGALGWILRNLFVEVEDEEARAAAPGGTA